MSKQDQTINPELKVLVVDDLSSARKILSKILRELGINNIEEACNGKEALDKVMKSQYGLIISDWEMPEMCGLDLLKNIRSRQESSSLPFIMITSHNKREMVIEAAEAGISDYICKPFAGELLLSKIENSLKKPILVLPKDFT